MNYRLIQQYYVSEDGHIGCKTFSSKKMMTLFEKEAPANSVPAAAVIQGGQVLFLVIRRKGFVNFFQEEVEII